MACPTSKIVAATPQRSQSSVHRAICYHTEANVHLVLARATRDGFAPKMVHSPARLGETWKIKRFCVAPRALLGKLPHSSITNDGRIFCESQPSMLARAAPRQIVKPTELLLLSTIGLDLF